MIYAEKLKDPRWQKKRLEVLERDEWTCQRCFNGEETLHVHHRIYCLDQDPWDYNLDDLVTLCATCHESEKEEIKGYSILLVEQFKRFFWGEGIRRIAGGLSQMKPQHLPDVLADVYAMAFSDPEIQHYLIDKFFEKLETQTKELKNVTLD